MLSGIDKAVRSVRCEIIPLRVERSSKAAAVPLSFVNCRFDHQAIQLSCITVAVFSNYCCFVSQDVTGRWQVGPPLLSPSAQTMCP